MVSSAEVPLNDGLAPIELQIDRYRYSAAASP